MMKISNEFLKFAVDQYVLWKAQFMMWNYQDIAGKSSSSPDVLVAQCMKNNLKNAKVFWSIDHNGEPSSAELTPSQLVAHALSLIEDDDEEYERTMEEIGSDTDLYKYMNARAKRLADAISHIKEEG